MPPDSPTLTALLAAATPGEWVWKIRPRRHSLRVMTPKDGCLEAYWPILETDGDYDEAEYRGATEADRGLLALARPLAEEVIRLRAELSKAVALYCDEAREKNAANAQLSDIRNLLRVHGIGEGEDVVGELRAWLNAPERKVIAALESRLAATWPKGDEG